MIAKKQGWYQPQLMEATVERFDQLIKPKLAQTEKCQLMPG